MPEQREPGRDVLPIPDRRHEGLITYDAKDPDTSFPAIEPLRPPAGAPNVLVVLLDDVGFGASSAFGGPCATPTAERLAAGGLKYNRFHTTALCSPTRQALLTGPQPSRGRDGRDHRDRDLGARLQLGASEHGRAAGRDAEAQRLLDGAVRQVPRGAGVGDEPDGAVRRVADRRRRVRALLRLRRRRDESVGAGAVPRHGPGRARPHGRGGLPLHRGPDGQGDRVGQPAEGADARQAVLRLLRAGRGARAAPRPAGVVGQVQGPVRRRLGRAARAHVRPPEGARRDPRRRRADRAPGGDPGLGRDARRAQAGAGAPDGGLRRLPGARRPPPRPAGRLARRAGDPRRHADLLRHRRQRRLRRGHRQRHVQRAAHRSTARARWRRPSSWRRGSSKFGTPEAYNHYAVGWAHAMDTPYQWTKQVASHWGGTRNGTIVHWPDGIAARGRGPLPVPPRDRHRRDRPRRRRAARADQRQRRRSRCRCTASAWPTRSTTPARPSAARPSTSRSSATAASTTRAGPR